MVKKNTKKNPEADASNLEVQPEPDSKIESETKPEPEVKTETEAQTKTATKSRSKTKTAPVEEPIKIEEPEPEPAPVPVPAPAPAPDPVPSPAPSSGILVETTPASDFSIIKADASGSVVFALMVAMGTIMYFSYRAFQTDYMLLFCGLFVFLAVYPGLNLKVKNANSKIILEVSIAFASCMGVFLILKAMHIPDDQHSKILIIFVTLLGMRFIFFPAYNVGVAEDQRASS